ncbi:acyltransferase [Vibrio breoganii]|uniref:acyltransferase n=1 Tax=Vibrio breoganii TaxID=553239 RepID=UPI000CB26146|nr:acyltransferase [Vibrio breoganii]PMK30205.1 hypothetical protein BCU03_10765 [Vibrio breoganii]
MKLKIFNLLRDNLLSCNQVAKNKGVTFGRNCKFLTKKFGSEPYLLKVGDDFYSSSNVQFVTHDGAVNVIRNMYSEWHNIDSFGPIIIGDNVFIGYGAIILPNTEIGNNVIVGAGSLVRGKLNDNCVYAGNPIKLICSIDEYNNKNKENYIATKFLDKTDKKDKVKEWISTKYPHFFN